MAEKKDPEAQETLAFMDEEVLPMNLNFENSFTTFRKKQTPIRLVWTDVEYSIGGTGSKKRVLLNKISGEANPGEVVALMGPSGAGKTTLLNVLSGRIIGGRGGKTLSGTVTANGEVVRPAPFRKRVAYVTQEDALFATATAREALELSARLRLPKSTTEEERKKIVDDMIDSLGLKKCENTLIGSQMIRGLSGGEKKRVAIGVELVSNPACLFLDEPTSGLDSYSAYVVVQILKAISSTGCTTICSIHQPSSEVFNSFDSLVLLGRGNVIYQGPIRDVDSAFAAVGLGVPPNTNIADHVMLSTQTHPLRKLPRDNENRRRYNGEPSPKIEAKAEHTRETHTSVIGAIAGISKPLWETSEEPKPNIFVQAGWLSRREFKSFYRDKGSLIARFGGTAFLNVLFAIIFLHAADQSSPKYTVNAAFGALVQIFIGALFGAAQPALLTFPLERITFIREKATGTYGTLPYVFAKLLVELPVSFATALLTMLVSYWTIGFNGNFFLLILSLWALMLASTSTAYILGSAMSSAKAAQQLSSLVLVPQLLFLGLFIRIDQIPVWLRWIQYLCAAKYGLNLAMLVEFDPKNAETDVIRVEFENLLAYNNVVQANDWIYALVLIAIFAGFRLISLIILNERAKNF